MNYTKGEWIYEEELLANMSMISCGNKVIAGIPNEVSEDEGVYLEQVANANLIAAAPDMYETCKAYIGWLNKTPGYVSLNQLDALHKKALAKAEGKEV